MKREKLTKSIKCVVSVGGTVTHIRSYEIYSKPPVNDPRPHLP